MVETYVIISFPFGWMFLSKLQEGVTIFTTISNYIIVKGLLSFFVGPFVMPFYLIYYGFKLIRGMLRLFGGKSNAEEVREQQ